MEAGFDRAFAAVTGAVTRGAIPCGVLGLVAADGTRRVAAVGCSRLVPDKAAVLRQTWFDLASLTKVIFTTTSVLALVCRGELDLDAPLASAIPDLRQYDMNAAERRLTFRQCLSHQTHLPAVEPLYTYGLDPATLRAFILQREWRPGPPVYSDINFMLLGIALERLGGGMALPAGLSFAPARERCAATEFCTWRGRVLQGEVHDENAFALGGRPGHAGLFGTADGVLGFLEGLLRGEILPPEGMALIRARQAGNRTAGWEAASPGWFGGDACGEGVTGHTGFTGTAVWLDYQRQCGWTLLTNRVHPTRHRDSGIAALRRVVGDCLGGATL